jgi:hypothetical protein
MNHKSWAKRYLTDSKYGFDGNGFAHFSKGALIQLIEDVARKASSEGTLDAFRQGVVEGRDEAAIRS